MTELRRLGDAVAVLERLVEELVACHSPSEAARLVQLSFVFGPPPRTPSAAGLTEEQQASYAAVESQLVELEPIAERARRRCSVRSELDEVKAELRARIGEEAAGEDVMIAVEALLSAGAEAAASEGGEPLAELLARAHRLEAAVTYGARGAERARDLLQRLDAVRVSFEQTVVPQLGVAVAVACAREEERRAMEQQAMAEAAEQEVLRQLEEARRPLAELLEASEAARRLREAEQQHLEEMVADRQPWEAPTGRSAAGCRGGGEAGGYSPFS